MKFSSDDELRARVLAEVSRAPSPTRRGRRRLGWALAGSAALILLGSLFFLGLPPEALTRPTSYVVAAVASSLLLALAASRSSVGSPAAPSEEGGRRLRSAAFLTPLGLAGGALVANLVAPTTWAWPSPRLSDHAMCLAMDLLLSVVLLVLASLWLRRRDPWFPKTRGAAAGAAAGAWVMLLMAVRCPQSDPIHVLVTHFAPVLLPVVLGVWLGSRAFGFGYRPR